MSDGSTPKDDLVFNVIGEIQNDSLFKFYFQDELEMLRLPYIVTDRKISGLYDLISSDLIILEVTNNSHLNCKCGLDRSGLLSTRPLLILDSNFITPRHGILPPMISTIDGWIGKWLLVNVPPGESRLFLVKEPRVVKSIREENNYIGYLHNCYLENVFGYPIFPEKSKYYLYFVYEYRNSVKLTTIDKLGEIL